MMRVLVTASAIASCAEADAELLELPRAPAYAAIARAPLEPVSHERPADVGVVLADALVAHDHARALRELEVEVEVDARAPAPERRRGVYDDWRTWCEGPAEPCLQHGDCKRDRTGRARKCIKPWWSERDKVCAIPMPRRRAQERTREDLRRIVVAQCGRGCNAERLFRFVALIAARESSYRPWKHHRLNPDVVATRASWKRQRAVYRDNPHYATRSRWQGFGLMGQQSATFTMLWDAAAPPEILCRPTVAVATYLSCARRAHRKQASLGIGPTWETVHTACSLGQVVPKAADAKFRARAARAGLDPEERIDRAALGQPLGPSPQARNLHLLFVEATIGGNES